MCEAENCVKIREFKQVSGGVDSSCIYGSKVPQPAYASFSPVSSGYGPRSISY